MVAFVFAVMIGIVVLCLIRSNRYYKMSKDMSLPRMKRKEYEETSETYANVFAGLAVFAVIFMLAAAANGRF